MQGLPGRLRTSRTARRPRMEACGQDDSSNLQWAHHVTLWQRWLRRTGQQHSLDRGAARVQSRQNLRQHSAKVATNLKSSIAKTVTCILLCTVCRDSFFGHCLSQSYIHSLHSCS